MTHRIGIVGSGPSGFFSAEHILRMCEECEVDMFERYFDPFGLVRKGVAPDSPKIREVTRAFDNIAKNPRFAYFGNVEVGRDISISEMLIFYDAIILACGMETSQRLGIPGEDLPGSYTANSIVGWYNCHPVYRSLDIHLDGRKAIIIGMGNVSLDVARILLRRVDQLKPTDISNEAIEKLEKSNIEEIYIVGRRGPAQAKFKENELLTLKELSDVDLMVKEDELILNEASKKEMKDNPSIERIVTFFERLRNVRRKNSKVINFLFYRTPIRVNGRGKVEEVIFEKNNLVGEPYNQKTEGTGIIDTIPCDMVVASIGYRGNVLPGIPFDERRGIIPNEKGRVIKNGNILERIYVAGWIKRGPVGLIGHNRADSLETVSCLLEDLPKLEKCTLRNREEVIRFLHNKNIRYITYSDWKVIDEYEQYQGKLEGKIRKRVCSIEEVWEILGKSKNCYT
ncbi:MAG: FAD-dependent oxidoreductase [Candidatus Hydrogenedentes bacterium]|nr:FAD-dependent oxidoreductase [Candidatus Hydrogenedentota bacterium]